MSETTTTTNWGLSTKDVVKSMLLENTGTHFLDSGGSFGRHWQRNQGHDFEKDPIITAEWSYWRDEKQSAGQGKLWLSADVSLYHWMNEFLEFDPELQDELDAYTEENPHKNWLACSEGFADQLNEYGRLEAKPQVFNTYNDPDNVALSQVIQYTTLYMDGDYTPSHLIINVHGGADVRGGYGAPKVFKVKGGGSDDYYDMWYGANAKTLWGDTDDFSFSWDVRACTFENPYSSNEGFETPEFGDVTALDEKDALIYLGEHGVDILALREAQGAVYVNTQKADWLRGGADGIYLAGTANKLADELEDEVEKIRDEIRSQIIHHLAQTEGQFMLLLEDKRLIYIDKGLSPRCGDEVSAEIQVSAWE